MQYKFPAIFHFEENGYLVNFHDLEGCFTEGDSINEAVDMASDALNLYLYSEEKDGLAVPAASAMLDVQAKAKKGDIVMLVAADTAAYKKQVLNRAVVKSVSIPQWLDIEAKEAKCNLSKILQKALKQELKIN